MQGLYTLLESWLSMGLLFHLERSLALLADASSPLGKGAEKLVVS